MERSKLEESFAAFEAKLDSNAVMDDAFSTTEGEKEPTHDELVDQRIQSFEVGIRQREEDYLYKTRKQVQYASEKNPDEMSQVYEFSDRSGIPSPVVEKNLSELKKREQAGKIDNKKNPALTRFYSDKRNAEVAHDDIDVLAELEDHLGAFNAGIISFPQMIAGGTAAGIEAGGRLVERALPESWVQALREFDDYAPDVAGALRTVEGGAESLAEYLGPEEQTFSTQVAGGLGQAASQIGAMLVAPQAAFPALFAQNISQQEQRREDSPTDATLLSDVGLLASGGLAVIEKFGLEKLLNRVPMEIQNAVTKKLTDIAIGGGYEAVTEVMENVGHGLVDYLTNNPDAEIFKGVQEDAAVGGTVGAIIRAFIPSYKGNAKSNAKIKESDLKVKTVNEQEHIDGIISYLQKSKLAQRDSKALKRFLDELPQSDKLKVSAEAFESQEGALPKVISDQLDSLGTDVELSVDELSDIIHNNPELLGTIRPHMRISDNAFTPVEMDSGGTETVETLMKQAEENAQIETELDVVGKDIINQLVETNRMSVNNARTSSAPIVEFIRTKVLDKGLTVKEVVDDMNLVVTKMEQKAPDFGDEMIVTEGVTKDTGQKYKVRQKKQKVYDQKVKQKDIVTKLRDCVNG